MLVFNRATLPEGGIRERDKNSHFQVWGREISCKLECYTGRGNDEALFYCLLVSCVTRNVRPKIVTTNDVRKAVNWFLFFISFLFLVKRFKKNTRVIKIQFNGHL